MHQTPLGQPVIPSEHPFARERFYPETSLRLSGRRLALVRGVWVAVAVLGIGLYLASIPPLFIALQNPCAGPKCLDWQLSPEQIQSLHERHISLGFYAGYFTALGGVVALIHAGMAAFIFWRKPADWLALFGSLTLLTFGVASMRPAEMPQVFPELSEREREILSLIAQGYKNAEIAAHLVISPKTVRNHVTNILSKLQVADRAQAIIRAKEAGLG